jgi:hypothetical protein
MAIHARSTRSLSLTTVEGDDKLSAMLSDRNLPNRPANVAGPMITSRMRHHIRPHWIQFDAAIDSQQIALRIHSPSLVTALSQRAAALVGGVNIANAPPS